MPDALEALTSEEFTAGIRYAVVALGVGIAVSIVAGRAGRSRALPVAGLLFAAAAWLGLEATRPAAPALAFGLVALAVAGVACDVVPALRRLLPLLALPGALILATRVDVAEGAWIRIVVATTVVVGGCLVAAFDRRWADEGFAPVLLPITVVGAYFTTPDTERMLVLVGAALPIAFLGWPRPWSSLGAGGSLAAVGIFAWTLAGEGIGRPSSIVGAVACLGLLAVEPLARALSRNRRSALEVVSGHWWAAIPVAALHLGTVAVASRVAGLRPTVGEAVVLVSVDLVITLVVVIALGAVGATRSPERAELS